MHAIQLRSGARSGVGGAWSAGRHDACCRQLRQGTLTRHLGKPGTLTLAGA